MPSVPFKMSDKIPYSKVDKKSVPAAKSKAQSSNIKPENRNAGKGDKPRHDISAYSDNYDEIDWS